MTRILSQGTEISFADYIDWDEDANIRDYDLMFINLRDLEQRKDEFLHAGVPSEYRRQYNLPNPDHVLQLLRSGGDIIVGLPRTASVKPAENQEWEPDEPIPASTPIPAGTPILNLFSWLPFTLEVHTDGGKSVDESTIDEEWDWYFKDQFSWDLSFSQGREDVEGIRFKFKPLAENRYHECLGVKAVTYVARGKRTTGLAPDMGTVYLVPLLDGWGFETLAEKVLEYQYPDIDVEAVGEQPAWLSQYSGPREESLEETIAALQEELQDARAYKQLLWEQGDELEKVVYQSFRDAGLTIEEEVDNRRDGAIDLGDTKVMLEITGTSGGVTEGKLSQLQKWVGNNEDEFEQEVTGLFVINHQRDQNPSERRLHLDEARESYLENRKLQMVTTLELFKMLHGLEEGDLTEGDVEAKLRSEEDIIVFEGVETPF